MNHPSRNDRAAAAFRLALASAALASSFLAWGRLPLPLFPFLAFGAVLFGHLARRNSSQGTRTTRALAAAGLLFGYVELLFLSSVGLVWWSFSQNGAPLDPGGIVRCSDKAAERLLLGMEPPQSIVGGKVIRYPTAANSHTFEWSYFQWRYDFPGFRQAPLGPQEARNLLKALRSGREEIRSRYDRALRGLHGRETAGGVLFLLKNGDAAFISILQTPEGTLFYSQGESTIIRGISIEAATLLERPIANARPEIQVSFPELDAEHALRKGNHHFGGTYERAVEYVRNTPQIIAAIGPIRELRPARGPNKEFYWKDYSADFTFRVIGANGIAAVRVENQNDSWTGLEMMLNGELISISDPSRTLALVRDPQDAQSFAERGEAYWQTKVTNAAIEDFTKALDMGLDPSSKEGLRVLLSRADAYCKIGSFAPAVDDYSRAIKAAGCEALAPGAVDGTCLWTYFKRGRAYKKLGMAAEALRDDERARQPGRPSPF
jgi:tetratricopeptide (TPR) repeat protein